MHQRLSQSHHGSPTHSPSKAHGQSSPSHARRLSAAASSASFSPATPPWQLRGSASPGSFLPALPFPLSLLPLALASRAPRHALPAPLRRGASRWPLALRRMRAAALPVLLLAAAALFLLGLLLLLLRTQAAEGGARGGRQEGAGGWQGGRADAGLSALVQGTAAGPGAPALPHERPADHPPLPDRSEPPLDSRRELTLAAKGAPEQQIQQQQQQPLQPELLGVSQQPQDDGFPVLEAGGREAVDAYAVERHGAGVCDRSRYPPTASLAADRVTVLVNGFAESRLRLLQHTAQAYACSPVVEAVFVLWGNTSSPAEAVEAHAGWLAEGEQEEDLWEGVEGEEGGEGGEGQGAAAQPNGAQAGVGGASAASGPPGDAPMSGHVAAALAPLQAAQPAGSAVAAAGGPQPQAAAPGRRGRRGPVPVGPSVWRVSERVFVVRQRSTSLNDRFLPRPFIGTRAVAICDDDITVDAGTLEFALAVWAENEGRLVGFFPRAHTYDISTRAWVYTKLPDRYSIVLTKLFLLHTDYLFRYTCHTPAGVKAFVDAGMNCEDIAMNFVVAQRSRAGPLLVEGRPRDWGDTRNSEKALAEVGLSAREGHKADRGACITEFQRLWGGMELRYSHGRVSRDVTEEVDCLKFGFLINCDARAKTFLQAQRAAALLLPPRSPRFAFATLVASPDLLRPALVWAQSLRLTGSPHELVLLLDSEHAAEVDPHDPALKAHFDSVRRVPPVPNPYSVKGFAKLHAWQLTEFERVVYVDADTLVLGSLDHLFERPEVAAAPDVYMSGKFNSGVLVLKPCKATHERLLSLVPSLPSYNKGDQGFLNAFFSGWFQAPAAHRLPARYNAVLFFPPHYHPPDWFRVDEAHEALRGPLMVVHFANPWFKPWRLQGGAQARGQEGTEGGVIAGAKESGDGGLRSHEAEDGEHEIGDEGDHGSSVHQPPSEAATSATDAEAEAVLRAALMAASAARAVARQRAGRRRRSRFHTLPSAGRRGRRSAASSRADGSSSNSSGVDGAGAVNLWVALWLHLARALEGNAWQPLDPSSVSLLQFLPNAEDYRQLPDWDTRPKYRGGGFAGLGKEWPGVPEEDSFGSSQVASDEEGHAEEEGAGGRRRDLPVVPAVPHFIGREGFVTVVSPANCFAAAVWAVSFAQHHSFSHWRRTLLLVLSSVPRQQWHPLRQLFNDVRLVEPMVVAGQRLADEFAVLHVWNQLGFDKVVYVDPLAIFCDNANELLLSYEAFAAPPAVFPPDSFSSRVMVIQPHGGTFRDMMRKLARPQYPTATVELFLNSYYSDWYTSSPTHRIIPSYNVDLWFKEGLMKFFIPWRIVVFDARAPPWGNISDWMAHDRTKAVKMWRRNFCLVEENLQPSSLRHICADLIA